MQNEASLTQGTAVSRNTYSSGKHQSNFIRHQPKHMNACETAWNTVNTIPKVGREVGLCTEWVKNACVKQNISRLHMNRYETSVKTSSTLGMCTQWVKNACIINTDKTVSKTHVWSIALLNIITTKHSRTSLHKPANLNLNMQLNFDKHSKLRNENVKRRFRTRTYVWYET